MRRMWDSYLVSLNDCANIVSVHEPQVQNNRSNSFFVSIKRHVFDLQAPGINTEFLFKANKYI